MRQPHSSQCSRTFRVRVCMDALLGKQPCVYDRRHAGQILPPPVLPSPTCSMPWEAGARAFVLPGSHLGLAIEKLLQESEGGRRRSRMCHPGAPVRLSP